MCSGEQLGGNSAGHQDGIPQCSATRPARQEQAEEGCSDETPGSVSTVGTLQVR